ncbi:MAG TPA: Ldh family oxidoreductase [Bryobacteraceae bacterium]|jgi:LDH2 family malate/lactate/ureidoglycolate dehydrogenase|nr:Ldh family oxidoreductase [Bryobacteraceae bacterium]
MQDSNDYFVIPHQPLADFGRAILEAVHVRREAAILVADSLVSANLRGVDSHGVQLLIWYTQQIQDGNIDIATRGEIASENESCMVYDGRNGLGQVVSDACCDHAIRLAREHGIGMVTARNSSHFGASAWWAQKLAAAGFIGIVTCNATPLVAAWQGRDKILGTNPICMAVPGPDTFLLDMATTTVALNRIHKAILSGDTEIPEGWAMDAEGHPTTDPKVALEGLPMPLGGYKGTGLALMVEVLCAVLSGGAMMTGVGGLRVKHRPMRVSHFFLAIDAGRFLPMDEFQARMQQMRDTVKGSRPAAGFSEVLIAGDPEWRSEEQRRRDGIPVSRGIWQQLTQLAEGLNVAVPVG